MGLFLGSWACWQFLTVYALTGSTLKPSIHVLSKLWTCWKTMKKRVSNVQNPDDIPLNPGWFIGIHVLACLNKIPTVYNWVGFHIRVKWSLRFPAGGASISANMAVCSFRRLKICLTRVRSSVPTHWTASVLWQHSLKLTWSLKIQWLGSMKYPFGSF